LRAIILANGPLSEIAQLRHRLAGVKYFMAIAANGGIYHAEALGIHPTVVVGDLDSLDTHTKMRLQTAGTHFEASPARKDETDLELALLYAKQKEIDSVVVLGALGGRIDMTLANVLLLTHPQLASLHIELWHNEQTAWIIRPPGGEICGNPEDTVSLIPLGGDVEGITSYHLAYPLSDETLRTGPARGISNVLTNQMARVEIRAGTLLVIHTPGRA
jgi:thiamine pyrophosphokinase